VPLHKATLHHVTDETPLTTVVSSKLATHFADYDDDEKIQIEK
jgi:hypothetical protein